MVADDVEGGSLQSQNLCHVVNTFLLSSKVTCFAICMHIECLW